MIFAKKWPRSAAGERLAWENTTLEKKLDRTKQPSELHKVMQSAFFPPISVKSDLQTYFYSRKTCRIFSQRRVAHLFLASFFADQKIDCDGSGKPGLHTLTFLYLRSSMEVVNIHKMCKS